MARVAHDGDPEQGAGRVVAAEEAGYLIPGGHQVIAIAAGYVDGRLEYVLDRRPGLLQGSPQVAQGLAHLRRLPAQLGGHRVQRRLRQQGRARVVQVNAAV
jgi:hypothetical protein